MQQHALFLQQNITPFQFTFNIAAKVLN